MDCRAILLLGRSWSGDAVGRSTRSPAIAWRRVRYGRMEGLVERASSDSIALHQRHGIRGRWRDLDRKRRWLNAIRSGGARGGDVVHLHAGQLAVNHERRSLTRV